MSAAKTTGFFGSLWKAGRLMWDPQGAPALINVINMKGGSPAATELLYKSIRRHAEESDVPVLAFAQSVAASGGYWAMCAADELFALNTSLVGSMGVMLSGFGAQDAAKKLGIERRLYTAGTMKGFMDPFREVGADEQQTIADLLQDLHRSFQDVVIERRGQKLKAAHNELFSGRIWTGRQAAELGLVDGVTDVVTLLKQRYGPEMVAFVVNPPPRTPFFGRFLGMTAEVAGYHAAQAMMHGMQDALEESGHRSLLG